MSDTPNPYLTLDEASELLKEIETKNNLFQHLIDGWSAWQLLRLSVGLALMRQPINPPMGDYYRKQQIMNRLLTGISEIPKYCFPGTNPIVVKSLANGLREESDGRYRDHYFDDYLEITGGGYKILGLNNPQFNSRWRSAYYKVSLTSACFDLFTSVLMHYRKPAFIETISREISHTLQKESKLHRYTPQLISILLRSFYWQKRIYRGLLNRIKPHYVMVTDTAEFPIKAAAKELGIKTVELQHGLFDPDHPDVLPAYCKALRSNLITPDQIFLFGDYWREILYKGGFYDQELVAVGSPRIERYRQLRSVQLSKADPHRPCRIVITTQGLDIERLVGFIKQFTDLATDRIDYEIYFKLHPNRDPTADIYRSPFTGNRHIQVLLGTEQPDTYELLTTADLHLSISSACHYDALGLGIPTVILPLTGHDCVMNLLQSKHALLAGTPEELLEIVMNWKNLKVPLEVSHYYFKPNAQENIRRALGL